MKDESPIDAVTRVLLSEFGIKPDAVQAMRLIDAVQQSLPPHPDATIASLRAILRDLTPHNGLESWAWRCSREIVSWLSKQGQVHKVAVAVDDERLWCCLEGTLAGMLMRVARGQDLEETNEQ
jgi:hypothetical protein